MSQIPLWVEYYKVEYALSQPISEEVKQWNPTLPKFTNIHEYFQITEKLQNLHLRLIRNEPEDLKEARDQRGEERVQAARKQWREETKIQRQEQIKEQAKKAKFSDFNF